MKPVSFTIKSNVGINRVLITPVFIIKSGQTDNGQFNAIWDTGATGTAITKNIAQSLGLVPTGITQVSTANGTALQNTYTIDVGLPNQVTVQGIVATEVDALSGGCDVLIGMDIITLGDFSITNHQGVTCMSFRMPSSHEIDYVKSPDFGIVKIQQTPYVNTQKIGRNDACHCGSGKKYKNCHGASV